MIFTHLSRLFLCSLVLAGKRDLWKLLLWGIKEGQLKLPVVWISECL